MRIQSSGTRSLSRRLAERGVAAATMLSLIAALTSCTSRQREGSSPAYLIIESMLGSSGADPGSASGTLASDVETKGGIFEDNLQVTLRVALKDPGSAASPNEPTTTNWITVTRYSVRFVRADGRNAPGVDVPYAFDGGMTLTAVPAGSTAEVTLVRAQAKAEAPLLALAAPGGLLISTIAEVTFYGHDQAGRAVSVVGKIGVNFANWADPE